MNKLAIFALLVICGAVIADDCTPLTSQSTCAANTACTFTATTGNTCVDKCPLLNATDCGKNTTNCKSTAAACGLSTCTGADSTACTASGTFCKFTAATGTCAFTDATAQTTTCHTQDADATECAKLAGCKYDTPNTKCINDDTYCVLNGDNTACTVTTGTTCKFTSTVAATCTNKNVATDCSTLTDNTTCGAKSGCTWTAFSCSNQTSFSCGATLVKADCEATTKFCTFDTTGTCATTTSSSYGAYLTAAGSILAATILI